MSSPAKLLWTPQVNPPVPRQIDVFSAKVASKYGVKLGAEN